MPVTFGNNVNANNSRGRHDSRAPRASWTSATSREARISRLSMWQQLGVLENCIDTATEGMPATSRMPEAAVKSETQGCQQQQAY